MEKQIREVQQYFKDKILAKDFEIKIVDAYTVRLSIDNCYSFIIWIGNWDLGETRKNYQSALSFMDLQFTDEESLQLHDILSPEVELYLKNDLIARKEKELEDLKKSLKNETY